METRHELIHDEEFKARHRTKPEAFTRMRKLTFSSVMILLLQKSQKSLQLMLNEFCGKLDIEPATAGAFTQARANLRYTALIELNQKGVVEVMYRDDDIKLYKGMRGLAIDGSKVLLPQHESVIKEFGEISYNNDHPDVQGAHAYGLVSSMYDVLNRVAVDSVLGQARDYEVDWVVFHHLPHSRDNDLLIFDRNYANYLLIALLVLCGRKFVIRCSASSFSNARKMLSGEGADDQVVALKPHHTKLAEVRFHDLPEEIKIRFVRVRLETGEYEVLVTNLLDTETFPTAEFKAIYPMRWGVEGFYKILKSRLTLENFTGKTADAVYQDFYAAVYLSGLETILTGEVNASLAEKNTQHPQQVNHAVAFNAIKNKAFELLASDLDSQALIQRLESLFTRTPTVIRQERKVPRKKRSARQRLNYVKRKQKVCF